VFTSPDGATRRTQTHPRRLVSTSIAFALPVDLFEHYQVIHLYRYNLRKAPIFASFH
jgi:hypothetical protein